jgi:hypothetical protein
VAGNEALVMTQSVVFALPRSRIITRFGTSDACDGPVPCFPLTLPAPTPSAGTRVTLGDATPSGNAVIVESLLFRRIDEPE